MSFTFSRPERITRFCGNIIESLGEDQLYSLYRSEGDTGFAKHICMKHCNPEKEKKSKKKKKKKKKKKTKTKNKKTDKETDKKVPQRTDL